MIVPDVPEVLHLRAAWPPNSSTPPAARAPEAESDWQVYALSGLTYDEVKIIDPSFALSAENYQYVTIS